VSFESSNVKYSSPLSSCVASLEVYFHILVEVPQIPQMKQHFYSALLLGQITTFDNTQLRYNTAYMNRNGLPIHVKTSPSFFHLICYEFRRKRDIWWLNSSTKRIVDCNELCICIVQCICCIDY
jgi:hypothetical protein